ncbi:hypothetical protein Patl1_22383 [Pistacia atlantica]|uniref:Uncharacterized protein n=1 Tax=Pistacia atlantica TaxID=434234 RepID=A0ACC1A2V7_9ROSI|nr:hypothetical protein Patl1_22383 [Pistacia atlantica]
MLLFLATHLSLLSFHQSRPSLSASLCSFHPSLFVFLSISAIPLGISLFFPSILALLHAYLEKHIWSWSTGILGNQVTAT